jgi:hypothetical protein
VLFNIVVDMLTVVMIERTMSDGKVEDVIPQIFDGGLFIL